MKILIVGDAYSVHTYNFINETLLHMGDNKIVICNFLPRAESKRRGAIQLFYENNGIQVIQEYADAPDTLQNLENGLYKIMQMGEFDICHLHFLEYTTVTVGLLVRKYTKKLIANYWGSDWFRADDALRNYQKKLLLISDYIVTDSLQIYEQAEQYYGSPISQKLRYIRFKMPVIEEIKRIEKKGAGIDAFLEKYDIPKNKLVITCGYSGSKAHMHKKTLRALCNLSGEEKRRICIVIPATYGNDAQYISELKDQLGKAEIDFKILEKYMNFIDVAGLRLATDIFINMQMSDAYSSTMIEYTYCNKVIIYGKWLDYSELEKQGAHFEKINQFEELTVVLKEYINNINKSKKKFFQNRLAAVKFQENNDKNELWVKLYQKENTEYYNRVDENEILTNAAVHFEQIALREKQHSYIMRRIHLLQDIQDKIRQWIQKNNGHNIGIYGAGVLGEIVFRQLADIVEWKHLYVFDKNVRNVGWFPDFILEPEQMVHQQMEVVIVTPVLYGEEIKHDYKHRVPSRLLTCTEWLDELEKL